MIPEMEKVIGATLREMRLERGLTQQQVAASLHTSQTFVSKTEKGKRGLRLVEAVVYSVAFNVTPRQLYDRIKAALLENGLINPYNPHGNEQLPPSSPRTTGSK